MKIIFVDTPKKIKKYEIKTYVIGEDEGGLKKWFQYVIDIDPDILYIQDIKAFKLDTENGTKLYYNIKCDLVKFNFIAKIANFFKKGL